MGLFNALSNILVVFSIAPFNMFHKSLNNDSVGGPFVKAESLDCRFFLSKIEEFRAIKILIGLCEWSYPQFILEIHKEKQNGTKKKDRKMNIKQMHNDVKSLT